jgi:hypothetical protein
MKGGWVGTPSVGERGDSVFGGEASCGEGHRPINRVVHAGVGVVDKVRDEAGRLGEFWGVFRIFGSEGRYGTNSDGY